MKLNKHQQGFTIVELMIATAVFSVVLLLCAVAIVQVGRMFYKGTILNRTQNAARTAADDVSQAIQFGSDSANFFRQVTATVGTAPGTVSATAYCLGDVRYTAAPNTLSLGSGTGRIAHVLWKDRPGATATGANCTPANITSAALSGGQELLGDSMRLAAFTVSGAPGTIWSINLTVAYGATDDVFANPGTYTQCASQESGGQFCAVSTINTNVVKRL
jgi:prepilin-type N-terminal cleavage/methylation domain-containing protein